MRERGSEQSSVDGEKSKQWMLNHGNSMIFVYGWARRLEETVKYLLDKMKLETAVMSKDTIYLGVLQKGC